jgi:hypothetical protein
MPRKRVQTHTSGTTNKNPGQAHTTTQDSGSRAPGISGAPRTPEIQVVAGSRQKRKYTRRKKPSQNVADDDTIIKLDAKKRGRKRGRKKRNHELVFKPHEVIDYMIRNFPHMQIEKIREKVINGLMMMRDIGDNPYLLCKFSHDGKVYYYDDKNTILNPDGQVVGYFIQQPDGSNKMYMINLKNKDDRTYQQIIDSIEARDNKPAP